MTDDAAMKTYERCLKLETEFGEYFSGVVTGDTPEEVGNHIHVTFLFTALYNTIP